MNFWKQKGVYILYDDSIHPVYAGQAGLTRKNTRGRGSCIGDRLRYHMNGRYRHGWKLFSWFGFCQTEKIDLRQAKEEQRYCPAWDDAISSTNSMNDVLASFEAILIEGFAPRFNSRGGDLRTAVYVSQYDENSSHPGDSQDAEE